MFDHRIIDWAIKQWRPRLRLCVREQGGHFEHQLGVGDSKYVVSTDHLLIDHVIRRMRSANFTIIMAYADLYFCHLLVIQIQST